MTHLLARLASQAIGSASGVYAAARVRAAEPLGLIASDAIAVAPEPVLERAFAVHHEVSVGTTHEGPVESRGVWTPPPAEHAPLRPLAPSVLRTETPLTAAVEARTEPPMQLREPTPPRLLQPVRYELSAEPELRHPEPLLESPQSSRSQTRTQTTMATRPDARMQPPAAPERDLEPTEVHVHIGRIEITAEKTQQPLRSKPMPARKTVGLDDYLAKRQRGAAR